jgi:hypothetical protein
MRLVIFYHFEESGYNLTNRTQSDSLNDRVQFKLHIK